jgi:hypothetical protein
MKSQAGGMVAGRPDRNGPAAGFIHLISREYPFSNALHRF